MLQNIKYNTLRNVALCGAFFCLGSGLYFHSKVQNRFRELEFYKKALRTFRQNRTIVEMLGEPIKDYKIDLGDTESNYVDESSAKVVVPVKGPKESGKLYVWASKGDSGKSWDVNRLEFELGRDTSRRLLVYNSRKDVK